MKQLAWILAAGAFLGVAQGPAVAGVLSPTSYDMRNGDSGTYHYWDGNYNGSGSTTTDSAPLSGGLGALTDGFQTTQPWYLVSNYTGTGPYVGWVSQDPTITFNFTGVTSYQTYYGHFDNSGSGGVIEPTAITISDGTHTQTYALSDPGVTVVDPGAGGPVGVTIDISGLGLAGGAISVTPHINQSYGWVFSDEMQFFGTTATTPEPASLITLGLGAFGAAAYGWRRRTSSAPA